MTLNFKRLRVKKIFFERKEHLKSNLQSSLVYLEIKMDKKTNSGTRKNILILEDNPELVELLIDMMSGRNDNIISVSKAEEAQPLLRKQKFDLLICDLHLPGMSGPEFLNRCQEENILPKKVMIISGDIENPELKPEFLNQFICLEKPFFVEKFSGIIADVFKET